MSRDDIAAFEASYTTPTILSAETGAHWNTIRAVLQSEGGSRSDRMAWMSDRSIFGRLLSRLWHS